MSDRSDPKLVLDVEEVRRLLRQAGASELVISRTIARHGHEQMIAMLDEVLQLFFRRAVVAALDRGDDHISRAVLLDLSLGLPPTTLATGE